MRFGTECRTDQNIIFYVVGKGMRISIHHCAGFTSFPHVLFDNRVLYCNAYGPETAITVVVVVVVIAVKDVIFSDLQGLHLTISRIWCIVT